MFGKKKDDDAPRVPVYTVQSLPRTYEPIQTLMVEIAEVFKDKDAHNKVLDELGKEGAKVGADAVIGIFVHSQSVRPVLYAYGTAIRYID